MSSLGYESYLIAGEQTAWNTPLDDVADMVQTIYEIVTSGLRILSDPIEVERLTGNASPLKNVQGMISCGGDLVLNAHANNMLLWLKHLLMDDTIDSVDNAPVSVKADGAWVNNVAFTLTTQPEDALTPPINCGKLVFAFTTTTGTGTITIVGRDTNGLRISEVKATGTDPVSVTSSLFYSTVSGITISGLTPGTVQINTDPDSYTHTIELGTDVLEGLTIEERKGRLPNVYSGCIIPQGVLTLADLATFAFTIIGRSADIRHALDGTTTPSSLVGLSRVTQDVVPNWGIAFSLNGVVYPVSATNLTFNNNVGFPETAFADSLYFPKPVPKGRRSVILTASIDYDDSMDFDALARGTEVSAILRAVSKPFGGRYASFSFSLPQAELLTYPDPELGGGGEILQELTVRGYGGTDGDDEISATLISAEASI